MVVIPHLLTVEDQIFFYGTTTRLYNPTSVNRFPFVQMLDMTDPANPKFGGFVSRDYQTA